jgi:hypothetical protein
MQEISNEYAGNLKYIQENSNEYRKTEMIPRKLK